MTKELKAKLNAKLLEAGLDKAKLGFITVAKEEEIDGVIASIKALIPEPPKDPTLEELIQRADVRSHYDKKITEALNKKKPPTPPEPPKPPTGGLTLEAVKELLEAQQQPLLDKLDGFEKNKARDAKVAQAKQLLGTSKIPEKLRDFHLKNLNPDLETPLEDWVKQQEEEHQTYHQSMVDAGVISSAPDKGYKPNTEMSEDQAQAIIDRIKV